MGCYTCNLMGLCQVLFTWLYPFILPGGEGYQEIATLARVKKKTLEGLMLKTSASVKPGTAVLGKKQSSPSASIVL